MRTVFAILIILQLGFLSYANATSYWRELLHGTGKKAYFNSSSNLHTTYEYTSMRSGSIGGPGVRGGGPSGGK